MTASAFATLRALRAMGVVAVAAVMTLGPAARGEAHAVLTRSVPANGAVLAAAPASVELWFSQPIAPRLSSARLVDAAGTGLDGGRAMAAGEDALRLRLPALAAGTYSVLWRVLSRDDGHAASGAMVFVVGTPTGHAPMAASAAQTPWPAAVVRWLAFAAWAATVGPLVVAGLVRRSRGPAHPTRDPPVWRLRRVALAAAAAGLGIALAELTVQTVTLAPGPGGGFVETMWSLVARSPWGTYWLLRTLALAGLVLMLRPGTRWTAPRLCTALVAVLVGAAVWAEAASGHAASLGRGQYLATVAMAVHVATAWVWVGGVLAVLLLTAWPGLPGRRSVVVAIAPRLGVLFATCAGALAVSGLYLAGRQIPWVSDLATTSYGRVLLVKLALFAALLAVAGVTAARLHGLPSLVLGRGTSAGRRAPALTGLAVEALLGLLVLGAAAVLVETPPAREAVAAPAPFEQSTSRSQGDLVLTLQGTPSQPGPNAFTVLVASTRRPEPAPVTGVDLRVGPPGSLTIPMTRTGAGTYFATATLPPGRAVTVTTVVHRAGQGLRFAVPWSLAGASSSQSRQESLAPWTNALARGLLVFLVAVAMGAAGLSAGRGAARRGRALPPDLASRGDRASPDQAERLSAPRTPGVVDRDGSRSPAPAGDRPPPDRERRQAESGAGRGSAW